MLMFLDPQKNILRDAQQLLPTKLYPVFKFVVSIVKVILLAPWYGTLQTTVNFTVVLDNK